ncbi:MAG: MMPL family transporter, partial [Bifidobacteriaceae bacterium]|nr:MMPL family transporter [Bifidobacteriaceae bacterium]
MLKRLAGGITRHPMLTLVVWLLIAAAGLSLAEFGVTGQGLFDRVESGAPRAPDSESAKADDAMTDAASSGQSLTLIVSGADVANESVQARIQPIVAQHRERIARIPGVANVTDPFSLPEGLDNPMAAPMLAASGNGFLVTGEVDSSLDELAAQTALDAMGAGLEAEAADLRAADPAIRTVVGGESMILGELIDQMEADLVTGEVVSLPIALIVMVVVFAGFAAASLPLLGALASIAVALGSLFGFSYAMDLHTSVINVVTVVGLGLSIDYGLLIVSRFREELRARQVPRHGRERQRQVCARAVAATLATAGRTVAFSALTIAASVAGLMVFKPAIYKAFGLGGLLVVLVALMTAITLVPACLMLIGARLSRPSLLSRLPVLGRLLPKSAEAAPESGLFSRLAGAVQGRPWLVIVGVLAVMAVLASPALHLQMRNSSTELLPPDSRQLDFVEQLDQDYPYAATTPVIAVSRGSLEETEAWANTAVAGLEHVSHVEVSQADGYVAMRVGLDVEDSAGAEATQAAHAIRDLDPPFQVLVTGPAAHLIDFQAALVDGAPWAAGIIGVVTLALLFLMTGSALIPIKALLTNALSLLACLGVVTWL